MCPVQKMQAVCRRETNITRRYPTQTNMTYHTYRTYRTGTCVAAVAGLREREAAERFPSREGHKVLRLLFSGAKLLQRVAVQGLLCNRHGQVYRPDDRQTTSRQSESGKERAR